MDEQMYKIIVRIFFKQPVSMLFFDCKQAKFRNYKITEENDKAQEPKFRAWRITELKKLRIFSIRTKNWVIMGA